MTPGYSSKAQPVLDALAGGVSHDRGIRDWLFCGTPWQGTHAGSSSLDLEQERLRTGTRQSFSCNLRCGTDACSCRVVGSRSLESDAIFFFETPAGRRIAVDVEFKHPNEPLSFGQAPGYRLRADCWAERSRSPRRVLPHDAAMCVIVCSRDDHRAEDLQPFHRVIDHADASRTIPGYPRIGRGRA